MIHVGSIVQATVDRIRDLTHDVRELGLRLREPKDIAFKAGQFISFDLTPPGAERLVIRPYSMASPPDESNHVTLVFQSRAGWARFDLFVQSEKGDAVVFEGPQGSFYLRERTRNILCWKSDRFGGSARDVGKELGCLSVRKSRDDTRHYADHPGKRSLPIYREIYYDDRHRIIDPCLAELTMDCSRK